MVIAFCLPFFSTAVPWEDDFDWNAFNYTPLVVGAGGLASRLPGSCGWRQALQGPDAEIEFDEAVGITEGRRRPARRRRWP